MNALDPGVLFCDLLHGALVREEEEIRRSGVPGRNPRRFLSSVACVPELAVGYLLRKEALRREIPLEGERRYRGIKDCVDWCLLQGEAVVASFEVKGPRGVWTGPEPLEGDIRKHFDRDREIDGAMPAASRYNAWILVADEERQPPAIERFVRKVVEPLAAVELCPIPPPIVLQENLCVDSRLYRQLWVVVFTGTLRPAALS